MTDEGEAPAADVHRLVTTDVGGRGTIGPIAEAADDAGAGVPPMRAAERLVAAVDPGDAVVVMTGFPIPPALVPETDGPVGAASVARALDDGLGANVIVAAGGGAAPVCRAATTAVGLRVVDRAPSLETRRTAAVDPLLAGSDAARAYGEELADLDPAAVLTVELAGPNRSGAYHNMAGYDVGGAAGDVEAFLDGLGAAPLTVAVGDSGNEVGMGLIEGTVRETVPYGDACRCPCGDGIACATGADVLVPAAVSNWGAHAIVACLAAMDRGPGLHDPGTERRMLRDASRAGGVDGIRGGTTGWCDGLPAAVHGAIVRLLGAIVARGDGARGGGEFAR